MGIPIGEDDPVNGACLTCIEFLPETLFCQFDAHNQPVFEGILRTDGGGTYQGDMFSPGEFDRRGTIQFCLVETDFVRVTMTEVYMIFIEGQNCDIPFTGSNEDGDKCAVTLDFS